jgi:ABC-type glycerol-3-phosphate transport system substrate-binding protein
MKAKVCLVLALCLIAALFSVNVFADRTVELKFVNSSVVQAPDKGAMEELVAQFEKENPDIKIVHIGNNPPWAKLLTLVLGGQTPDITQMYPQDIPAARELGVMEDLTPYIKKEGAKFKNSLVPKITASGNFDGKQLVLPFFAMSSAVLYNTEHFKNAGLAAPQTLAELTKASVKLTDGKSRWGMGIVGSKAPKADSAYSRLFPIMRSFGAQVLEQKGGHWSAGFNNAKGVRSIQYLTDLVNKYKVVPPGVTDASYNDVRVGFANGRISMMMTSNNTVGQAVADNPQIDGKMGAFLFPKAGFAKYASMNGCIYLGILKNSKHKAEAWRFVRFLLRPENQEKFAKITCRLPVTSASLKKDFIQNDPALKVFAQALNYNEDYPPVAENGEIGAALVECLQQAILGKPVKEAVSEAAKKVDSIMEKAKK